MSETEIVDFVLVRRLIEGRAPATALNEGEKYAAAKHWLAQGYTPVMLIRRLAIGPTKARRWAEEAA